MQPAEIALMLPEIYRRGMAEGSVLDGLLHVMAALHGSLEAAIADPALLIDPRRAPDRLVPVLAAWVGLGRYLQTNPGEDRPDIADLRELVAAAAGLSRRSGSAATLRQFLETATGTQGFAIEESAERPFHFSVSIPPAALPRLDLVLRIIAFEKPAFTTFELTPIPDVGPNQGS